MSATEKVLMCRAVVQFPLLVVLPVKWNVACSETDGEIYRLQCNSVSMVTL